MWKRGEIAPKEQFLLFSTLLYIYISNFRSQNTYSFVKYGCSIYCFPHSLWYVEVRISRSVSVSPLEFEITRVDCKYQKIHFLILRGLYFLTATVIRAKSCTNTFSGPVWFSVWFCDFRQQSYTCTKTCTRQVCCSGYTGSKCTTGKYQQMSRKVRKRTFGHVHPAKIPISLRIRAVWSESSLGAIWITRDIKFIQADIGNSDQIARMRRVIWAFVGCTCTI